MTMLILKIIFLTRKKEEILSKYGMIMKSEITYYFNSNTTTTGDIY